MSLLVGLRVSSRSPPMLRPVGGPIPLHRYRKHRKSRREVRADQVNSPASLRCHVGVTTRFVQNCWGGRPHGIECARVGVWITKTGAAHDPV